MITLLLLERIDPASIEDHPLSSDPEYNILTASTSESAIELAHRHSALIDLVVTDVDLGSGMTGIDTAQEILADSGVPVIFQLNTTDHRLIDRITATRALGCIDKRSTDFVKKTTIRSTLRYHHIKPKSGKWAHLFDPPEWELVLGQGDGAAIQAFDEIKKVNSILHATLDSIDEGILVVDRTGIINDLNRRFIKLWKIPEPLIADRDDKDLLSYIIVQVVQPEAFLKKVDYYYSHPELSGTDIVELKNGNKFERYTQPQRIDGQIVGRVWSFRDVTERMEADESLTKLLKAVNTSGDAIFLTDMDGIFTYVNPGFTAMYGYRPEDVVGKRTPRILKSGLLEAHAYETFWKTLRDKIEVKGEMVNRRRNGDLVAIDGTASPILDEQNVVIGYLGIQRDITERKRAEDALKNSERLLRESQEVAKIGYFLTDIPTGRWVSSPVLAKIFGIDDSVDHEGADWNDLIAPQFRQQAHDHYFRTIHDRGHYTIDYQIIRPADGETRWVSVLAELEYDASGTPVRMIGTVQDITERKLLEQQLLQSQKLEGLGTLAGGIAHDFNNLLSLIHGSAELLKRLAGDHPRMNKYVDRIIEASEQGASISRQLLMFSRPEQAELKPIQLAHTISSLQDMLKHFFPKSITITTCIDAENGCILGDAGHLHQALLNLALNAGDAMNNSGTLTIREWAVDAEFMVKRFPAAQTGPYAAISVSDTGTGIEQAVLEKIFDPFFTTKAQGKGTGLGLGIVHGIVKNHKGFIDVTSVPGTGSTFTLFFPMTQAVENELIGQNRQL
jgi:PAS domain S-box-containing protein